MPLQISDYFMFWYLCFDFLEEIHGALRAHLLK